MIKTCSSERTWADKLAMKLYDGIFLLLGNSMIFRRLGAEGLAVTYTNKYCKSDTDTCYCLDWIESWTLLNLDLAVASIVLNLFSGSDETASSHMLDAWKFMLQSHRVPDETAARAHHAMAFVQAKEGNCRGALDSLKKAETHREMAGLEPDAGLKQDIAKQVKHMKACNPVCQRRISVQHSKTITDSRPESSRKGRSALSLLLQLCWPGLRGQRLSL
jgi:hypothetical protein